MISTVAAVESAVAVKITGVAENRLHRMSQVATVGSAAANTLRRRGFRLRGQMVASHAASRVWSAALPVRSG